VELDIPSLAGTRPTPRSIDAAISPRINARRRADRCINEILGLIKGMLADGVVTDNEVHAFETWFSANPDALSVLVVGCLGNSDWAHTSFGRKIEAAVRLRRDGIPIAIVDERHWASQLAALPPHS
jgi:hypothetical protein